MKPLGGLGDPDSGDDRQRWAGSVADLLYDGERVRERVEVGDSRAVVTTHRLLAFTSTREGDNYRQVDLPNVDGVAAGHDGEDWLLLHVARAFLYGAVLLAVGVFVDFETFVPADVFAGTGDAVGRLGLGGVFALMRRVLTLLASLDELARLVGAVVLLGAVAVLGIYVRTRERAVVVSVAGDEDVVVPVDAADTDAAVADLERALFDAAPGAGGSGFDSGEDAGGTTGPDSAQ